jgi:hypothetical protein
MVRLRGDKEIGDRINKIIQRLAETNDKPPSPPCSRTWTWRDLGA